MLLSLQAFTVIESFPVYWSKGIFVTIISSYHPHVDRFHGNYTENHPKWAQVLGITSIALSGAEGKGAGERTVIVYVHSGLYYKARYGLHSGLIGRVGHRLHPDAL